MTIPGVTTTVVPEINDHGIRSFYPSGLAMSFGARPALRPK